MVQRLLEAAVAVRQNAYAPYSGYLVGAAILDSAGNIWTGCNVENISYGLCICAERSAVSKMVGEGHQLLMAIGVATKDGGTPCGMCLQTLLEFAEDPSAVEVHTISESGEKNRYTLNELMPHAFTSDDLRRT